MNATLEGLGELKGITGSMNAGGTEWRTTGKASATTTLQVEANVAGVVVSNSGSFNVEARPGFPAPQIVAGHVNEQADELGGAKPRRDTSLTGFRFDAGNTPWQKVLPVFGEMTSHLDSATTGPNAHTAFLLKLDLQATLLINADLLENGTDPSLSFKADQNGTDGTSSFAPNGIRYCTASDMPALLADVRAHEGEGLADQSHVGVPAGAGPWSGPKTNGPAEARP